MPIIDKKSGLITTDDNHKILFHGNKIDITKNNNRLSLHYERLVGGAIVIYKDKNKLDKASSELLKALDNALKEMEFSYEIK